MKLLISNLSRGLTLHDGCEVRKTTRQPNPREGRASSVGAVELVGVALVSGHTSRVSLGCRRRDEGTLHSKCIETRRVSQSGLLLFAFSIRRRGECPALCLICIDSDEHEPGMHYIVPARRHVASPSDASQISRSTWYSFWSA